MANTSPRYIVVRNGAPEGHGSATPFLAVADDPFAQGRHYHVNDGSLRYGAGLSETGACDIRIERMPHTEFLLVWEGEVTIQAEDNTVLKLLRGDCAVIPAGARLRWVQAHTVRRSFIVFHDPADTDARDVIKIDAAGQLAPSPAPADDVLLTPAPRAQSRRDFTARSGQVRIGVWQCTPYKRRTVTPSYCELMYFLSGEVTFTEPDGTEWTVGEAEAIVVPAGATNAWTSDQTVRKVFCIVG